jgi:uncharacterized protein YutE (UPF0331/DUF86 family)
MMERIASKIGRIRENINMVRSMEAECHARFSSDAIYRGALLHYLYLVADGCIVLAELVIKRMQLRVPQSYAETFDILGENGILERHFAYEFARIAGFRNFLAHDYERIDPSFICDNVLPKLTDVEHFVCVIETKLASPA